MCVSFFSFLSLLPYMNDMMNVELVAVDLLLIGKIERSIHKTLRANKINKQHTNNTENKRDKQRKQTTMYKMDE
jgi:hypothetical protein